jgi:hypothetical protein
VDRRSTPPTVIYRSQLVNGEWGRFRPARDRSVRLDEPSHGSGISDGRAAPASRGEKETIVRRKSAYFLPMYFSGACSKARLHICAQK